jgi:hypothetical protein
MFRVIHWPIFREYNISCLTEVIDVHACGRYIFYFRFQSSYHFVPHSVYTEKRNTEALLVASKESGLERSAGRTE